MTRWSIGAERPAFKLCRSSELVWDLLLPQHGKFVKEDSEHVRLDSGA
jgi:hypothetical protein